MAANLIRAQGFLVFLAIAALALTVSPSASASNERYLAPAATCSRADELQASLEVARKTMLCLVNYARRAHGLQPLRPSRLLDRAAALKLEAGVRCDTFSHTPCGAPVTQVFEQAGYVQPSRGWTIGENLALGVLEHSSPRGVLDAWLSSPAHRRVLLTSSFRELGVGMVRPATFMGERGAILWATTFGARG